MTLKTGFALLGAVIAATLSVVLFFILGGASVLWIDFIVVSVLVVVGYIVAACTVASAFGEFMRGWLVGLNAALNVICALVIVTAFAGVVAGIIAALAIGLVVLLSTIAPISQSAFYQGVVGYLNWLLPMSWVIVALGAMFYAVSLLLHAVTIGRVAFVKVTQFDIDWPTGTLFMKGGLVANLNILQTAFNMGNFSFVHRNSSAWHTSHEAGHTLNLAVFGALFHLIGAIDENVLRRGSNAFSERLAESNASSGGSVIPMWS
jgi:hypothetical protein